MEISSKAVVTLVLCTGAAFWAGGAWNRNTPAIASGTDGHRILYYHDPMHPSYKSEKPGISPDCGMQLEPVYADGQGPSEISAVPGTVRIDADKQQLIGVHVEEV